jgi:hypothetical protein
VLVPAQRRPRKEHHEVGRQRGHRLRLIDLPRVEVGLHARGREIDGEIDEAGSKRHDRSHHVPHDALRELEPRGKLEVVFGRGRDWAALGPIEAQHDDVAVLGKVLLAELERHETSSRVGGQNGDARQRILVTEFGVEDCLHISRVGLEAKVGARIVPRRGGRPSHSAWVVPAGARKVSCQPLLKELVCVRRLAEAVDNERDRTMANLALAPV